MYPSIFLSLLSLSLRPLVAKILQGGGGGGGGQYFTGEKTRINRKGMERRIKWHAMKIFQGGGGGGGEKKPG